ncbi:related to synaptic vesicle transporter SVOP and related transporters (major facilitator superfamily) [Rhynchosporium agropyri]|uniref:Related to synaptic vesicle transporter SVOP and related transporters (Major facilitator superfamily) n=1 Tax=Rhynchosporium agropyri TaxID=914238 RepID=A0A1E1KBJ5_9HELO|nr:related to synaptic vesicle transporter SVOP and related transporters (major facilitator superfamily) [Rhynchosporium agropyri]
MLITLPSPVHHKSSVSSCSNSSTVADSPSSSNSVNQTQSSKSEYARTRRQENSTSKELQDSEDRSITLQNDGNNLDQQDSDLESFRSSSTDKSPCSSEKAVTEPPYHVFTLAQKKQMTYIVSLAALFSPLSSNIYFPALGRIAKDLNVSLTLMSLTVTVYMVVQGLVPSFWGPVSDTKGRRITFIGTFAVYLIANIGLAFSRSFTCLMVFRGIQAAGSAATISIGAGVIGDITTSRERGGLIGIFGGIRMLAQSIGPVFGGIISEYLGHYAIFWSLFGVGAFALFIIVLLLPETLRSIAGDGTVLLRSIHRPLIYRKPSHPSLREEVCEPASKLTIWSMVAPLTFLFEKDIFVTLFFGSIVYAVWSMMTSSTTPLFQARFGLNDLEVGLVFLPNGAGCVAGSYLTGRLMDHDYRIIETRYREQKGLPSETPLNRKELLDFPIEQCRLRNIWWIVAVFILCTALYGFSLNLNIIALPLILQFCIAYTATAVFSLNSALIIDLYPRASASATAVNNLMRCTVGALGVAIVQIVIDTIGEGVAFVVFAGFTALCSPLLVLEWVYGQRWRGERREKLVMKEDGRKETGVVNISS